MNKLARGFRGYETDDDSTNEWVVVIGKILLNFGAVEMQSYFWLEALSDDDLEVVNASKMQFSMRLHRVRKLIKKKMFAPEVQDEMLKVWECSEVLSQLRNKVAHNPLFFSYSNREPEGAPDFVGIPTFRKSKKDQTPFKTVPLSSLEHLKSVIDAVHENVINLTELYDNHLD